MQSIYGLPTSERSIRRAVKRWGLAKPKFDNPGYRFDGDEAEVVSTPSVESDDIDDLLRERDLDPDDWIVVSLTVNKWDSPTGEALKQLKVHLKRKKIQEVILPARVEGWIRPPSIKPVGEQRLVVSLADQHAPFHDLTLHAAVLSWLEQEQPEEGVLMGDLVDFADISRHRFDPKWAASTQECLDSGYRLLRDYVQASPTTNWTFIEGNHENRLRSTLLDYAKDLYGLRPGSVEEEDPPLNAYGIEHLLRLDELGIKYLGSEGTYDHSKVRMCKNLAAIHGKVAVKGSGASALKTLDAYGHSVIQGHSHRQSIVHKTVYDIDGQSETLLAAEVGCLCQLEGGLGYTTNSNWQQGWATISLWPDETFKVDLATFVNGHAYWRDERY